MFFHSVFFFFLSHFGHVLLASCDIIHEKFDFAPLSYPNGSGEYSQPFSFLLRQKFTLTVSPFTLQFDQSSSAHVYGWLHAPLYFGHTVNLISLLDPHFAVRLLQSVRVTSQAELTQF